MMERVLNKLRKEIIYSFLIFPILCCSVGTLYADSSSNSAIKRFFPASYAGSIFDKKFENAIEIEDEASKAEPNSIQQKDSVNIEAQTDAVSKIEFQSSDVTKKKFLPPDQTPSVAVNPEAPSSIISMIESSRRGDRTTAKAYAKQFVRTLQNYFFEVNEITSLIGDALMEQDVIKSDDWIGAEQSINIEMAKTRLEKGVLIKPTHDVAMKRIIADPKKEVEVYFFFSRSCSYCRFMASDVERLARVFKNDERVKLTGLAIGDFNEDWLKEFKDYTGLSIPVFDGTDFAKHLKVGFLPVLLVVTPNGSSSYFKTGQQEFERMYEFVRTAQGLPVEDSVKLQSIIKTPIGVGDKLILASGKGADGVLSQNFSDKKNNSRVNLPKHSTVKMQVEKF